jgi:hypothetical protein
MGKNDESEWDRIKAGRLDEHEHDEFGLLGHRARGPRHFGRAIPATAARGRLHAPVERVPQLEKALRAAGFGRNYKVQVAPCHIHVSRVTRPRSIGIPKSAGSGARVVVAPWRGEVRKAIEAGARRHTRENVYTMAKTNPFLRTPAGARMAQTLATLEKVASQNERSALKTTNAAGKFQAYVERARLDKRQVREEIEFDAKGAISFGTLGPDFEARGTFWGKVFEKEKQGGAVLQWRIIAELPYWILPEDRREILTRFSQVFVERGYGYWAVSHLPKVGSGSDPRNVHAHVIWHDRSISKWDADGQTPLEFSKKKSRDDRGPDWIMFLRQKYVEAANSVILEVAQRDRKLPVRLLHHGSYEDLGIHVVPQRHEGPKRTALRRKGMITRVGARNDRIETIDQDVRLNAARRRHSDALSRLHGFAPSQSVLQSTDPRDAELRESAVALHDGISWARRRVTEIEALLAKPFERDAKRRRNLVDEFERHVRRIEVSAEPLMEQYESLRNTIENRRREWEKRSLEKTTLITTPDPPAHAWLDRSRTTPRPAAPSTLRPSPTGLDREQPRPAPPAASAPFPVQNLVLKIPTGGSYYAAATAWVEVLRKLQTAELRIMHEHTRAAFDFARTEHQRFGTAATLAELREVELGFELIKIVARERGVALPDNTSSPVDAYIGRERDRGSYER